MSKTVAVPVASRRQRKAFLEFPGNPPQRSQLGSTPSHGTEGTGWLPLPSFLPEEPHPDVPCLSRQPGVWTNTWPACFATWWSPSWFLGAEIEGRLVAIVLSLPDYNPLIKQIDGRLFPFGFFRLLLGRRKIKKVRILATSVLPEYQLMGVSMVLLRAMTLAGQRLASARSNILGLPNRICCRAAAWKRAGPKGSRRIASTTSTCRAASKSSLHNAFRHSGV